MRGPLRTGSVQHHVLFKVTPDATRRTKTAKCTKYQIFQLMLNGLKRCHALNAVQFGGDVSETHPDSVMNFHQISEICESNFHTPEVIGVPVGYVNRENFNLAFQIPPGEEFPLVNATWGCFLGGDLLFLLSMYGLNVKGLFPCPVSPLTWDDLSNVFWFPVEDKSQNCKMQDIMSNIFDFWKHSWSGGREQEPTNKTNVPQL